MSEARNLRKAARRTPKEEQNYTVIEGGIPKVIPWLEYKENYLNDEIEPVPAEAE